MVYYGKLRAPFTFLPLALRLNGTSKQDIRTNTLVSNPAKSPTRLRISQPPSVKYNFVDDGRHEEWTSGGGGKKYFFASFFLAVSSTIPYPLDNHGFFKMPDSFFFRGERLKHHRSNIKRHNTQDKKNWKA